MELRQDMRSRRTTERKRGGQDSEATMQLVSRETVRGDAGEVRGRSGENRSGQVALDGRSLPGREVSGPLLPGCLTLLRSVASMIVWSCAVSEYLLARAIRPPPTEMSPSTRTCLPLPYAAAMPDTGDPAAEAGAGAST